MSKHNYDIFISYRKRCSGDKPEMLQLMLEESGFRKRVSFDKDNLNGRFDVELIRRIDECKDFNYVYGAGDVYNDPPAQ